MSILLIKKKIQIVNLKKLFPLLKTVLAIYFDFYFKNNISIFPVA